MATTLNRYLFVIRFFVDIMFGFVIVQSLFYCVWYLWYLHKFVTLQITMQLNPNDLVNLLNGNTNTHDVVNYEPFTDYTYINVQPHPDPEYICGICYDKNDLLPIIKLRKCFHEFHEPCTRLWLEKHRTCPICRQQ